MSNSKATFALAVILFLGVCSCVMPTAAAPIGIAAGGSHTLVIQSDGTVWSWGCNNRGQLGDGTTTDRHRPAPISSPASATFVAAGQDFSMAVNATGLCGWGANDCGQLGDGTTTDRSSPVQSPWFAIPDGHSMVSVAAGATHTLALDGIAGVSAELYAWGSDTNGELGLGGGAPFPPPPRPSPIVPLLDVSKIAAGSHFSLALLSDGTVWAWGRNDHGQLGDGTTRDSNTPIQVTGLSRVTAIAAGHAHAVALTSSGTVWTWGCNDHGQLGMGTTTDRWSPFPVAQLSGILAIAAGAYHTIALQKPSSPPYYPQQNVYAWGDNTYGQLGDGTTTQRVTPVSIYNPQHGLPGFSTIAAGYYHNIAAKSDGTFWAWGCNACGQLGDGTTLDRHTPVPIYVDTNRPVGTVTINNGAAYTASKSVTLNLSASDSSSSVTYLCISTDGVFDTETWQIFSSTLTWTLPTGDGTKTVYVMFRDQAGNVSTIATASIGLDQTPPTGSVTIDGGAACTNSPILALNLAATDAGSNVAQMCISTDGVSYSSWQAYASTATCTVSGLDGKKSVYVKFKDEMGNVSPAFSSSIILDTVHPTTPVVSVTPMFANASGATLTMSSSDANGIAYYLVKVDTGAYTQAQSPYPIHDLSEGRHTLYVIAVDPAGNQSNSIYTRCKFDLTAPTAVIQLAPQNWNPNTGDILKGDLAINITPDDSNSPAGGTGVKMVEVKLDGGDYATAAIGEVTDCSFTADPITSATTNGTHTVYVRVTDYANNQGVYSQDFVVNKNEVSGTIDLQGLTTSPVTRDVTFVLNGDPAMRQTVPLIFNNREASFSLTDVPEVTSISAKTAWNLRAKLTNLAPDNGQTSALFTGSKSLLGGDLNGDNVVNTIDYVLLRNSWGPFPAGDITGDGITDNADYALLKASMYKKGDAE